MFQFKETGFMSESDTHIELGVKPIRYRTSGQLCRLLFIQKQKEIIFEIQL